MKRFLKRFSILLLVLILAYPPMVFVWGYLSNDALHPNVNTFKGSYGFTNTRLKEVKEFGECDLLILGSSRAYRHFDVRLFEKAGYRVFNLGTSSQTPIQTKVLLERYLPLLNPKLVLYEAFPQPLEGDGVESGLDILANDMIDLHAWEMAFEINHIKIYNTLFYRSFKQLLGLDKDYIETAQDSVDTYISGGYVEMEIRELSEPIEPRSTWNIKDKQSEIFLENMQLVENSGAELWLIDTPLPSVIQNEVDNPDVLKNLAPDILYLNLNELVQLDDQVHFYDPFHMNQRGVELTNETMIDKVKSKFDKRTL